MKKVEKGGFVDIADILEDIIEVDRRTMLMREVGVTSLFDTGLCVSPLNWHLGDQLSHFALGCLLASGYPIIMMGCLSACWIFHHSCSHITVLEHISCG